MTRLPIFLFSLLFVSVSLADEEGELIFSDDFERSESQEVKDEPGNGWETNSASRANGNKQVDLRDGAMYIYIHKTADHGVSVKHAIAFTDGAVGLRFKLEGPKDILGLNFADLGFKEVHAGHLFAVKIGTTDMSLQDLKTGVMDLEIRTARKAGTLTKEQEALLVGKSKKVQNALEIGKWYDLLVEVNDDSMTVSIDGEQVGAFQSEGISHPTKTALRLAVSRDAVVDDLKIWKR
tara:strand:- start:576 stop:1283 length:708 start_codon:yes stop_codon:yes gene_type:complete